MGMTLINSGAALARDIKISHSIFAMPFAIFAVFLARPTSDSWGRFAGQLVLIIGCMITGRTAAMLANRILDRKIDRDNPRTAGRAVASGRVALHHAIIYFLWSVFIFIALCAVFGFLFDNWWPFLLSIPVLAWICLYPLMKQITWLCHLYLGASLAISPIAAAIAIEPISITEIASLWYLAAMVLTWVAGFDIIYALQDIQVDQNTGINSIPARFGQPKALWFSRSLHVVSVLCLFLIIMTDQRLATPYFEGATILVVLLLIVEHVVTTKHGTGKIQLTFFTLNGVISCILGIAGIVSILQVSR